MPKLPTQPENAQAIPLRSGFYALPFNGGQHHLFARLHHQQDDDDEDTDERAGRQVFVTGVPLGMTGKGLKQTLSKVWHDVKLSTVDLLPGASTSSSLHGPLGLLTKEVTAAEHAGAIGGATVSPLFDPSSPSLVASRSQHSSGSAIVTFSSRPAFPPPAYPSATTTLSFSLGPAASSSFLARSASKHALARPHRSVALSHVDTWMQSYDQRKLAQAPASYSADVLIAERQAALAEQREKLKRGKKTKTTDVGPVPGSAAEALARHAEEQRKRNDTNHNPDEVQDGEWTLVTGGGKHGKSLLPAGVVPTVEGYGAVTVKVARKKRGKADPEGEEFNRDAGIKKIVGDGFYRFNQADSRRKSLAALRTRFEEDKARVDRMRNDGGGRGRGRGSSRGRGGSSSFRGGGPSSRGGRGGRGGGASAGREGRSYKPY